MFSALLEKAAHETGKVISLLDMFGSCYIWVPKPSFQEVQATSMLGLKPHVETRYALTFLVFESGNLKERSIFDVKNHVFHRVSYIHFETHCLLCVFGKSLFGWLSNHY